MIGSAAHGSMGGRAARPIAAENGAHGSIIGRAARPIAAENGAHGVRPLSGMEALDAYAMDSHVCIPDMLFPLPTHKA